MHRSMSMPDVQAIRCSDRALQIGMGAADGVGQINPLGQTCGNGG